MENKAISKKIYEEFKKFPEGEKLTDCIQCGTCSASCPVSFAMDYTPRKIIAMLRADKIEDVLKSDTVWLCASCYSCTVRCPAGIKFTDFMYHLKRIGLRHNILPKNKNGIKLAKSFCETTIKYGRNFESELMVRYNLRTNILNFIKIIPFGIKLLLKKRMPLLPSKIKNPKIIKNAIKKIN